MSDAVIMAGLRDLIAAERWDLLVNCLQEMRCEDSRLLLSCSRHIRFLQWRLHYGWVTHNTKRSIKVCDLENDHLLNIVTCLVRGKDAKGRHMGRYQSILPSLKREVTYRGL